MDDLKTLIEELNRINNKAAKMSPNYLDSNPMLCFEIEFSRAYIEDALNLLEKSIERQERKERIA